MKIELRPFREKYADELSKIIYLCADKYLDLSKESKDFVKSKNTPEEIVDSSKDFKLIVALLDGKVVGCGGLDKNKIRKMFVHPKYHGKGIGHKIYRELEKIARKNKLSRIYLHSSPNAINFYKKFGFEKIKKDKFGSIKMGKQLK